jgi:hypothetical protein
VKTEWLKDEILRGLQQLLCLGLERQPAAEVLPGTASAWLQALTLRRSWDALRDTRRIRDAFVTLTQTRRSWPVPADLLDALPKVESHLALPRNIADPDVIASRMEELRDLVNAPPSWQSEGHRTPHVMSEAARELAAELERSGGQS